MRGRHAARTVLLVVVVCAAATAAAQRPTFRAGVETVPVYATVTDRQGALVANLTRDDFEVREDGKPVPLTVFEAGVQPITIAVLLDQSPSLFVVRDRIRHGVEEFVRRLHPADRATVGNFTQTVRLAPRLTSDPALLLEGIDRQDSLPAGTALWDAMDDARKVLEPEGGRRVLLMLTDGNDNCSWVDDDAVRRSIEVSGIMFYGIGLRGKDGLPMSDLKNLSRHSGGWLFELKPGDDLSTTFQRVADELHRQYVLGFAPRQLDGKVHRIEVRVRKSGMTVRARESYTAGRLR